MNQTWRRGLRRVSVQELDETTGTPAEIGITTQGGVTLVTLSGDITLDHVSRMRRILDAVSEEASARIDIGGASRLDTAGAWAICTLRKRLEAAGHSLEVTGADADATGILQSVEAALPVPDDDTGKPPDLVDRVEAVGRAVVSSAMFVLDLVGYLGLFLVRLSRTLLRPRRFRMTALVHHCQEVGLKAVPIVALMAFLIGVVLAFQGSAQLRQFGAEVFVVDLIAVSILRELGILLTAIIVAGRTASAFTAAIGSMKMREEIDAMRTLGVDPATVLFVPRILAMLLMLPILGLIANVVGLFGGALMAWIELGISPGMFRTRLVEGTDISHLIVGMVKAPVFALIIGIVGCHAGMQVGSDAESLGRMTSNSVVTAIFSVIVADALFSVFFAQVGI